MFANWTKVLPVFIVEWLAKRHLEKFGKYSVQSWADQTGSKYLIYPYSNIVILIKEEDIE